MPDGKRRPVVKYALVPSGRDACGWCYMLSSRGYFYGSEASAARSKHEGCKCVPWSSARESEIEDYDPEWMKKCWRDCCETVDYESVRRNAEREWERMEEAERSEWRKLDKKTRARIESLPEDIRKKVGLDDASLDKNAFDNYCGKRWLDEACNEVGRRDVGWLYNPDGKKREEFLPDFSLLSGKQRRRLYEHHPEEASTYELMAQHGFHISALPEDRAASANIDAIIHTGDRIEYWEIKDPNSDVDALRGLITEGVSKWPRLRSGRIQSAINIERLGYPRLIIDNRFSNMSDKLAISQVRNDLEYYRSEGFDQALVITKDGVVHRINRK